MTQLGQPFELCYVSETSLSRLTTAELRRNKFATDLFRLRPVRDVITERGVFNPSCGFGFGTRAHSRAPLPRVLPKPKSRCSGCSLAMKRQAALPLDRI